MDEHEIVKGILGILALAVAGLGGHRVVQALRGGKLERIPAPAAALGELFDERDRVQKLSNDIQLLQGDLRRMQDDVRQLRSDLSDHAREDKEMHERFGRVETAVALVKQAFEGLTEEVRGLTAAALQRPR